MNKRYIFLMLGVGMLALTAVFAYFFLLYTVLFVSGLVLGVLAFLAFGFYLQKRNMAVEDVKEKPLVIARPNGFSTFFQPFPNLRRTGLVFDGDMSYLSDLPPHRLKQMRPSSSRRPIYVKLFSLN